ncbi:dihydrofolate reductase family protein [Nakamurella antarctica]|uniref:dihydrofolate reductase family protein n=1 Tax=Nakamurella antarctica TaxID=1902245 RepID=UPI003BB01F4B
MVGRGAAVPHAGDRTHPPRAARPQDRRDHLPLPDRTTSGGTSSRRRTCGRSRRAFGAGATIARQFLEADLVDQLHIVVVPVLLGRGGAPMGRTGRLGGAFQHRNDRITQRGGAILFHAAG